MHAPKTFNYRCEKNNRCYPLSQYMNVNNVGSRLLSMALIAITHAEIILLEARAIRVYNGMQACRASKRIG